MRYGLNPGVVVGAACVTAALVAVTPTTQSRVAAWEVSGVELAASVAPGVLADPVDLLSGAALNPAASDSSATWDSSPTWAQVFQTASANLAGLEALAAREPSLFGEIYDNQVAYAQTIADAEGSSATLFADGVQGLPTVMNNASAQFAQGDVMQAFATVWNYASTDLYLDPIETLVKGVAPVMTSFGNNVDSLLSALPMALSDYILVSPLYALGSGVAALAEVVQEITQAQDAGDQTLALTDLSNAPAAIVDGFLNGYNGPDSDLFHGTPYGLLTYAGGPNGPDGTFQLLLDAEGDLAEEIKPFTAPASAAVSPLEFSVSSAQTSAQLAGALDGFDTAALLDAGHLSADVGGIFGQLAADLGAIAFGLIP